MSKSQWSKSSVGIRGWNKVDGLGIVQSIAGNLPYKHTGIEEKSASGTLLTQTRNISRRTRIVFTQSHSVLILIANLENHFEWDVDECPLSLGPLIILPSIAATQPASSPVEHHPIVEEAAHRCIQTQS